MKSGLRHPQPLPPIFQPEVAGRAIYWAAHRKPRELLVGFSTVLAIAVQKVAASIGDVYLAKTGYESQQTDRAIGPDRPDNLYEPADRNEDFGAHGEFDDAAKPRSVETELVMNRKLILGSLALVGAAAAGVALRNRAG